MSIAVVFLAVLAVGVPVVFVLGLTGLVYVWQAGLPLVLIAQRFFLGLNSFLVIAVPLFILSGNIMNAAGITERLVAFANMLVGRVRGGLAYVVLVALVFFSGVVGAGAAAASAVGATLIPALVKGGYRKDYAGALVAAGATIGPILPPSIAFVIYGAMAEVSIAELFLAGIIPGVLFALCLGVVVCLQGPRLELPIYERTVAGRELARSFLRALPGLAMPLVILGGMLTGIFTPTEAAAVGVAYALLVGFIVHRELRVADLWPVLRRTGVMAGGVMLIVATASLFSWILAAERAPQVVTDAILALTDNPILLLLMINLLLLLVGCIMETLAAIIILTPVLLPVATKAGLDPVHFGVILVVNLNIGLATPPVGVNLFVAGSIARVPLEAVSRRVLPFLLALLVPLAFITFVPQLSLFLPDLVMQGGDQ